jgi:hypothetical protein
MTIPMVALLGTWLSHIHGAQDGILLEFVDFFGKKNQNIFLFVAFPQFMFSEKSSYSTSS